MSRDVLSLLRKQERQLENELSGVRAALAALSKRATPSVPRPPVSRPRRAAPVRGIGPLQELLLEALQSSTQVTAEDLAKRLGSSRTVVNAALQGLDSRKLVERSGRGTKNDAYRWSLPRSAREAAE